MQTTPLEKETFGKIEISPESPPSIKKRINWKKLAVIFGSVLFIVSIFLVIGLLPLKNFYTQVRDLEIASKDLLQSAKNQELEQIKQQIPEVREKINQVRASWDQVYLLRFLPFLNTYHSDLQHGLNAGLEGLNALEVAVLAIEPYADLLGLKKGSSFVAGSADERIQLAVKTMDKLTPKIAEIGTSIEKIKNEIDAIDPNRYPEKIGNTKIKSKLVSAKQLIGETTGLFLNAKPLLEVLPQLLGEPKSKRYLVLFQNDAELRPTGGFITAYAIFKIDKGKISVEKSDDIYELDDRVKRREAAPEILKFHKGVYYSYIRDSNLSPDFVVSMKNLENLYPEEKFDFDGIVSVDTHVLVEAIKILGTFVVKGRTFSSEIDKRCDCPKVIYELEDYSTRPVAYVREDRKDILGELLLQIMKKALGVSPSQYWGNLFQMAISELNQKHMLLLMKDEKAQIGIEALNMGGRIANGVSVLDYKDGQNWDYLHINDANMASGKSNLFVEEVIRQEFEVESDGTIVKTITLDYKNPQAASDCNLESGGLCLNAHLYRNWVRIYVPKGSILLENKGGISPKDDKTAIDFETKEDLGKTVFEGFITLRPQGTSQVILKYKLPFKSPGKLSFLIQKQPGTDDNEYLILVKGKQKERFNLLTDKFFELSL